MHANVITFVQLLESPNGIQDLFKIYQDLLMIITAPRCLFFIHFPQNVSRYGHLRILEIEQDSFHVLLLTKCSLHLLQFQNSFKPYTSPYCPAIEILPEWQM